MANSNPIHFKDNEMWQQVCCIRDPLTEYLDFEETRGYRLEELLGVLPNFMNNLDPRSLKDQMIEGYIRSAGGPCYPTAEATITVNGVYQYPRDPDLFPIFVFFRDQERVFIYPHGLVAIVEVDENSNIINQYCTRMD
jgi:hypothetical protein